MIYPGHDYIENNLRFTLNREPDNKRAQEMLGQLKGQDLDTAFVSTLAVEREINTFFRLTSPTRDREAARSVSGSSREAGSAHGVSEAARAAEFLVSGFTNQ